MAHVPRRKGTILKYQSIQKRYKELHDVKRKRRDDCIKMIMREFFIENVETVWRILATDISLQLAELAVSEKYKPKQLQLF